MRHVDRLTVPARQAARRLAPTPEPGHPDQVRAILDLQATAGNAAVSLMLQRTHARHRPDPAFVSEMRGEAAQFAYSLSVMLDAGGRGYRPADVETLRPFDATFFTRLYQVVWNQKFGGTHVQIDEEEREADLVYVRTALPAVIAELSFDPDGLRVVRQIQSRLEHYALWVSKNAIEKRAQHDVHLAARLQSIEMADARAGVIAVLQKGWGAYSKFKELNEAFAAAAARNKSVDALKDVRTSVNTAGEAVAESPLVARILEDAHTGLETASKVAKAIDPDSYRAALKEAEEWVHEHHAGTAMGTIRTLQLETEFVELTLGTVTNVAQTLSRAAVWALAPTGTVLEKVEDTVEALEALAASGELGSRGGTALKVARVLEKLEKVDVWLNAVAAVGGVARFITADTGFERADAAVSAGAGGLGVAARVTGRAALGSWASSVLLTWEGVKLFGGEAAKAIEGSEYGGLHEELARIRPLADKVALAVVPLDRALAEQGRRFAESGESLEKEGAEEAVQALAHDLREQLKWADQMWRTSPFGALVRWYPHDVRASVGTALEKESAPSIVLQAGVGFMGALANVYHREPDVVIDMLVDDGYMTEEQAERQRKKLTERRKEAAG